MEMRVIDGLRRINRGFALAVGALLVGCAGLVLLDILLRQIGASFGGTDEISGYVMAIATSWGMAFTLLELGHVRIDVLRGAMASFGRALFDIVAMAVLAATVSFIAAKAWPVLARSLANGSRANTPLETPLAWVQWPWFAGWLWFAFCAILVALAGLSLVLRRRFMEVEPVIGTVAEHERMR